MTQALERYDHLQSQIQAYHDRILSTLKTLTPPDMPTPNPPGRSARASLIQAALHQVMGVDLTAIPTIGVETALTLAAEIDPDLSRFPDSAHFCSWLSLAPGTRISGEKRLGGHAPRRTNHAGQALRMAATTARRSEIFIGASHRARLARMDTGKAIKATAHQLARLIYAMLTQGQPYVEQGMDAFESRRKDRQRRALQHKARSMGLALVEAA